MCNAVKLQPILVIDNFNMQLLLDTLIDRTNWYIILKMEKIPVDYNNDSTSRINLPSNVIRPYSSQIKKMLPSLILLSMDRQYALFGLTNFQQNY